MPPPKPRHAASAVLADDAQQQQTENDWLSLTTIDDQAGAVVDLHDVLVVQLEVGDLGRTRRYYYASLQAAERAVVRAKARGKSADLTLCRVTTVGPVVT
jgi:hypothetical protein